MLRWGLFSKRGEQALSWLGMALFSGLSRALFEKRQFRAYKEFAANTTLKLVFTKPFILTHQGLLCDVGTARAVVSTGGTESGTFVAMPTKFCRNTFGGDVAGASVITTGGTVTLGAEREVLRVSTGTGGNAVTTATALSSARVLPAGTYYVTITVTGTTSGIYSIEWEEVEANTLTSI